MGWMGWDGMGWECCMHTGGVCNVGFGGAIVCRASVSLVVRPLHTLI